MILRWAAMRRKQDTAKRNMSYHCLEYDHDQIGELFLVACGQEDCDPGVQCGPDVRECYHLHVVRSGFGILRARGVEYSIHGGQMFLLKDGEEVYYKSDEADPWSYCWVTFNGSDARRITEDIGFTENVYVLDSLLPPETFFDLIGKMHQKPDINIIYDLYRKGVMMEFLAYAMEATGQSGEYGRSRRQKSVDAYIDQAMTFIHYNYRTVDVEDVIRFIGFSRAYFTTAFKKREGISIQQYLLKVRMQRAKELLAGSDLKIQDIASMAGYEDQLNFSRIFKSYEGLSPSEYRRRKVEQ